MMFCIQYLHVVKTIIKMTMPTLIILTERYDGTKKMAVFLYWDDNDGNVYVKV